MIHSFDIIYGVIAEKKSRLELIKSLPETLNEQKGKVIAEIELALKKNLETLYLMQTTKQK